MKNEIPDKRSGAGGLRSHRLVRWLFLRGLGVVYAVAFASWAVQFRGLVGSRGILPAGEFLDAARDAVGVSAYWRLPTLAWLGSSDMALGALCGAGLVLALSLIVGFATIECLVGLWALYLSLAVVGQTFFGFQWDALLLETGLVAMLMAPRGLRPRAPWTEAEPSAAARWLVWSLVFKLMFLSGSVKLLSGDPTWKGLTALDYHYWTQPLPTWTSWYAAQLPAFVQPISLLAMLVVEIGLPWLVFCGRVARRIAAAGLVLLQLGIAATGNYGFFNLLSIVLCLALLDDASLGILLPRSARARVAAPARLAPRSRRLAVALLALAIGCVSALTLLREMARTVPPGADGVAARVLARVERSVLERAEAAVFDWTDPFRSINGYGLFRVMTTERREIQLEGSLDGVRWVEYDFRWKPDDPAEPPRFVQPHMPRLDWQMWFAALEPRGVAPWLQSLVRRLLEGEPAVAALLGRPAFPDGPPRWVRLVYYDYRFAPAGEHRAQGLWWLRERRGETRPISLETFRPFPAIGISEGGCGARRLTPK